MGDRPLMLRVFLSSPGDVVEERGIARDVLRALESSHLLRERIRFDIVDWGDPYAATPLNASETPQASVNRYNRRPSECDLTLVILWSRLGTPLPPEMRRADGTRFESGTVWEFEDARSASKPVLVYRRTEPPKIDGNDREAEARRAQYLAVEDFFSSFMNPDGSARAGYNVYTDPTDFEKRLREHLEAFVNERLGGFARAGAPDGLPKYLLERAFKEKLGPLDRLTSQGADQTLHMWIKPRLERAIRGYLRDTLGEAEMPLMTARHGTEAWKRERQQFDRWAERQERVKVLLKTVLAQLPDQA
jgi:hypothetical protein